MSSSRDKLNMVSSWLCDDLETAAIAVFPSHVACVNAKGVIRIWTLPQQHEQQDKSSSRRRTTTTTTTKANDDKAVLIRQWQAIGLNAAEFSIAALPGNRLAVGSPQNIMIHDIETGEIVKTINEGGMGLCALPDVDFFTSQMR